MVAFRKQIAFLTLAFCGILLLPYAVSTPVDTPIGKNLTALLAEPSSSEVNTGEENALDDNLSYDAYISSDSTNNSSSELDAYYNGTDAIDNSTFYQHDLSNDTAGMEEGCEESDELIYYAAGSSTILLTVVFACVFLVTLGCVTYHNILNFIP